MQMLTIITTGGTIDKVYFDALSEYKIGEPQISQILHQLNVAFDFRVIDLMRKDSLELNDKDRELIANAVESVDSEHILITHGTDTMVQTAEVIAHIPNKTVVLTGALNPARFHGSDAVFNIGCAIGAIQSKPYGVWLAMNGRIWDHKHVRKNRAANTFESL
ncbi:MAG: asparaginase domain-containing protein [bacterium]